ncbi:hypothetical protein GGS23DRAFT_599670 [Durotheca rogersii]|uniref:uncharacterized protein n=1 Tax=Durotheca rogersii TaxID=419775 RepID=UPI002220AEEE|nr:uncharacterized protein GGS23DRAFT_599670 [Durotheca rogersii]KAI5860301.1 hypothetical protein GGS23DRAFT_599670 [Durotheca rogersii]
MTEALARVSGLTAIVQLTGCMIRLTKDLRVCMKTVRSAPKEIEYFIRETSIFTDQLRYFYSLVGESAGESDGKHKRGRASLVRKIVRQCRYIERDYTDLVNCFVEVNGADTSPFHSIRARILWTWRKPDVPGLRLSLHSATANVMLLCNLFAYEKLMAKGESEKDDEIAEMLRDQLETCIATARKLRREVVEHQGRKPVTEGMPDTRDLEKYVVSAIRSQEAREASLFDGRRRDSRPRRRHGRTERKTWATSVSGSATAVARADERAKTRRSQQRPKSHQAPDGIAGDPGSRASHIGVSSEIDGPPPPTTDKFADMIVGEEQAEGRGEGSRANRRSGDSETPRKAHGDSQISRLVERKESWEASTGTTNSQAAEEERRQSSYRGSIGPMGDTPAASIGGPGSRRRPRRPRPESTVD